MSLHKNLAIVVSAGLVLAGCGGASLSNGMAQLRAVSAIENPAAIDVASDVGFVATNLATGVASGFSTHPASNLGAVVREAGTNRILVSGNLNLGPRRYTLIPYPDSASTYDMFALPHNAGVPGAGKFRLRVVHVDRFGGDLDVYFTNPGADLSLATPVIQDLSFEEVGDYIDLEAGSPKEISITLANSTAPYSSPIALTPGVGTAKTAVVYSHSGPASKVYSD